MLFEVGPPTLPFGQDTNFELLCDHTDLLRRQFLFLKRKSLTSRQSLRLRKPAHRKVASIDPNENDECSAAASMELTM